MKYIFLLLMSTYLHASNEDPVNHAYPMIDRGTQTESVQFVVPQQEIVTAGNAPLIYQDSPGLRPSLDDRLDDFTMMLGRFILNHTEIVVEFLLLSVYA